MPCLCQDQCEIIHILFNLNEIKGVWNIIVYIYTIWETYIQNKTYLKNDKSTFLDTFLALV